MRIRMLALGSFYLWFSVKTLRLGIGVSTVNWITDEAA